MKMRIGEGWAVLGKRWSEKKKPHRKLYNRTKEKYGFRRDFTNG